MSIIARLKRVTVGKLEAFLTSVEDPEVVFPQLIREMEDQVRAATNAEAKAMAAVKATERARDQTAEKLENMVTGAEAALKAGDEKTAREAVEAQIKLEDELARRAEAVAAANTSYSEAHAARTQTQRQLDIVRAKKDEILTRARVAQSQEKIQRTVSGPALSADSILDAVAQMEAKVEEQESELAVRKEMGSGIGAATSSLEQRIEELHSNEEVARRLAELKAKVGGGAPS